MVPAHHQLANTLLNWRLIKVSVQVSVSMCANQVIDVSVSAIKAKVLMCLQTDKNQSIVTMERW